MKKAFVYGLLIVIIMALAAACGSGKPNQLHIPVKPFEFTNQDGNPVSLSGLKDKVWIADVIFTHCIAVCPLMTAHMSELQKRLKAAGAKAELISFSIDPENDDPAALKSYLQKFDADFTNWHALTGYQFDEIKTFILRSFKSPIAKDATSGQVIHDTYFYLVNQSGIVVAKYDGEADPPYDKIIKDVQALQR
ncbi:SCO family protein [Paenibacillus eucommiae]|uniref:Protein SCO1/2 n=1 Tax=Paenibacillus eucommiae TaxID=1355755 RepID=A0ABS4IRZ8_9BACL|nr:SCO family protein [Paenibacillus eucommiae]MBP1989791.1 protein SCO1/2 [Paenibacillus eucommiae]